MKSRLALLAVPFLALACTDAEQREALTNPPGPSFSFDVLGDLGNGCIDVNVTGVTTRRGGKLVVGTDGPDVIDCSLYSLPGSKGVIVKAGDGSDIIIGSPRADQLFGGKDCDQILAGAGNDLVDGGQGNDMCGGLFGEAGDDLVKGGKGDDFLSGGPDTDVCEGGPGTDIFTVVPGDLCEVESQGPP